MSLTYQGKLALSANHPTSVTAVAALSLGLSAALPVVSADLAGAVACSGQISVTPPDLSGEIAIVEAIQLGLEAAVSLATPYVSFQATMVGDLVAELIPIVAQLSASLALGLPLGALFAEGGVQAWSFAGASSQLGGLLTSAVGAGLPDGASSKQVLTGFVLAATASGTWSGLQVFFPALPSSQVAGTLVPLGALTVGELVEPLSSGVLAANVSLAAQLATLRARLNGAIAAAAQLSISPPTLASTLTLAGNLLASLRAVVEPGAYISASGAIAAVGSLVASLRSLVASLRSQVIALASITSSLATAGVLAFTYDGTSADLGGAVGAAIGAGWPDGTSSSAPSNACILLASGPGTGAAMSTLFGGI